MLAARIGRKPSGASKNVAILKRLFISRHPSEGDDTASGVCAAQLPLPFPLLLPTVQLKPPFCLLCGVWDMGTCVAEIPFVLFILCQRVVNIL